MSKTYSQIKAEALKSVQTAEDGEIVKKKRKRLSGSQKRKRAQERAAKKARLEEECSSQANNVTLEIIDSEEEIPDSRLQLPSTEDVLSDDNFENDKNGDEDVEDISLSEDEGDFKSNNDHQVLSLDEVSDNETSIEKQDATGENDSRKIQDPMFYDIAFYLQTFSMFTSLGPNESGKCQMLLKEGSGFGYKDFEGRKCKISINPNYHVTSSAGRKICNYSVTELETEIKLSNDPKTSVMLPLVDVEVTNNSDGGIHYPKGVAL